jgi:UDP-N-acetylmuramoyl-tripeptide--D-alanyl-D-alanine ligase
VTGSTGKTTTKDLIALALEAAMPTLKTEGNLNNHWGVPLMLLRLSPEHRAAVIEMGSNHPGEIALLARLAQPEGGVITNAGSAHIEYFGSVAGVAQEKAALGFAIPPEGWLVAGAESAELMRALQDVRCRLVTFGFSATADLHPRRLDDRGPAGLALEVEGFPPLRLSLVGRHQALNAMAALAVARELGLDPHTTIAALERTRAASGRMEVRELRGAHLLVDYYNANPESARAALESLAAWPGATRRIAVLGDMLELGEHAARFHREVGSSVRGAELWVVGRYAEDYASGARASEVRVQIFPDRDTLAAGLEKVLKPGVVVLFKASRGAALERVLEALEPISDPGH